MRLDERIAERMVDVAEKDEKAWREVGLNWKELRLGRELRTVFVESCPDCRTFY